MVSFWKIVNSVIRDADILLLVLDARMPELTRNREIEQKVKNQGKRIIYVLNKCDLVSKKEIEKMNQDYTPSVFISSKEKLGGTLLFKKIMRLSQGEKCVVGVLGYPNVGKSSVINLLKGKGSASVSSQSGHTRGIQFVKAKGKLKLIDTPGVLPFKEKDIERQVLIGSINSEQIEEPDYFAVKLIDKYPNLFEKYFDEKYDGDGYDFLERVAIKKNILKKGGKADLQRFGRKILKDWQTGKVHMVK
ncbi:hypothetical protein A3K72_03230 [Candidatus Woesearchaeota archaeon RBG_13_36_6]|nr:MAG: hypothetical protein A3K72_03230 [Candidatus Woesearchaeota archaeon RBG_13_36_6]